MKSTKELEEVLLSKNDIDNYLKKNKDELQFPTLKDYLDILLSEKNMTVGDVKSKTFMGGYIYEIFNGKKTNPSRDYILEICLAMELTYEQSKCLLKYAKVTPLYARDKRDSIVMNCICHSKGLMECNEILHSNGEEIFGNYK